MIGHNVSRVGGGWGTCSHNLPRPKACARCRSPCSSEQASPERTPFTARIPAERFFFIHSDVAQICLHVFRENNPVPVNYDGGIIRRPSCSASVLPATVALFYLTFKYNPFSTIFTHWNVVGALLWSCIYK